MPIPYSVSPDGLKIEAFPKGVLDTKETMGYFASLNSDTKIQAGATEIVNFKEVTDFRLSYFECNQITKTYHQSTTIQKIAITIFVCETELAFGIGRMLQTLHEITNPEHKVIIVRCISELEKVI